VLPQTLWLEAAIISGAASLMDIEAELL